MDRSQYKRLGDYIEPYLEKNKGLKVHLSQGINNNKYFQTPRQVAQDSENDQIVRCGQFAFNKATTRNGEKISIAYRDGEDCTVSSAYQVFYIKDEEQLNPYYLLLWFKRPEFDRYARFKSHGSAHEFFTWEEMCSVLLPVPPITEQRRIVNEYQTVERRIRNNEALIQKLEETAQAIYYHTFIEGIDEENLPRGWRKDTLGNIATILDKKRKPLSAEERAEIKGEYPYYGAMSIMDYIDSYIFDGIYLLFSEDGANVVDEQGHPALQYVWGKFWLNNHAHILQGNIKCSTEYLYLALKEVNATSLVTGAAQPKINQENMASISLVIADNHTNNKFQQVIEPIFTYIRTLSEENTHLRSLLTLLTSKIS